jgi:hypothetical protein
MPEPGRSDITVTGQTTYTYTGNAFTGFEDICDPKQIVCAQVGTSITATVTFAAPLTPNSFINPGCSWRTQGGSECPVTWTITDGVTVLSCTYNYKTDSSFGSACPNTYPTVSFATDANGSITGWQIYMESTVGSIYTVLLTDTIGDGDSTLWDCLGCRGNMGDAIVQSYNNSDPGTWTSPSSR